MKLFKAKLSGAGKKNAASAKEEPAQQQQKPVASSSSRPAAAPSKPAATAKEKPSLPTISEQALQQAYAEALPAFRDVAPGDKALLFVQVRDSLTVPRGACDG